MTKREHQHGRHQRAAGEHQHAQAEIASGVADDSHHVRPEESAQIAERVDQPDCSGRRGARQHRGRQRLEIVTDRGVAHLRYDDAVDESGEVTQDQQRNEPLRDLRHGFALEVADRLGLWRSCARD